MTMRIDIVDGKHNYEFLTNLWIVFGFMAALNSERTSND
jgi:hypothetical protein